MKHLMKGDMSQPTAKVEKHVPPSSTCGWHFNSFSKTIVAFRNTNCLKYVYHWFKNSIWSKLISSIIGDEKFQRKRKCTSFKFGSARQHDQQAQLFQSLLYDYSNKSCVALMVIGPLVTAVSPICGPLQHEVPLPKQIVLIWHLHLEVM